MAEDAYRQRWAEATTETAASRAEGIDRLMEIGGRFDEKITLSQPDYERLHLGLVVAYRSIGVSIETEPVKGARSIRHLLTHRGRALKTGNDAKRDKKTFGWSDLDLRLSLDEVMAHLDALAVAVDDADEVCTATRGDTRP